MDRTEPTMDHITEKEVLIEIYNEIKAPSIFSRSRRTCTVTVAVPTIE